MLNPYQRSFLQQMAINTEIYNWTTHRVKDFGIDSPKWGIYIIPFPSQGSGDYVEEEA